VTRKRYTLAMAVPTRVRCPTCHAPVATGPGERPRDYPFCSERCRLVDLHRWFSEEYRIAAAASAADRGPEGEPEEPA